MRILIISQFAYKGWCTHLGTDLEIAQRHIDAGDEVTLICCDSKIGTCHINKAGVAKTCKQCSQLREKSILQLEGAYEKYAIGDFFPSDITKESILKLVQSEVFDQSSAESFVYNGHKLGLGVVSSIITESRNPSFNDTEWGRFVSPLAESVLRTYLSLKNFFRVMEDFDQAYLFNGRFDVTNGALRACQEIENLDVYTHERGASIEKYMTFKNSTPHDRIYLHQIALSDWGSCTDHDARFQTADDFFKRRAAGADRAWKNFLSEQSDSVLPADFNRRGRSIVIFNSSEDEFVGLGPEWENPIYHSQSHGIEQIVRDMARMLPEVHIYLRMHPNLKGVDNSDTQRLQQLKNEGLDNFTLISPESEISTYALMRASDTILTFGSTIGVEATYWGKVSILAGHAFYELFDAAHGASSHAEVLELLANRTLQPKSKLGALIYGYHMVTRGEEFKYWQSDDFFHGRFKGLPLFTAKAEKSASLGKKLERIVRPYFKKMTNLFRII
jgi:hypothetical protein